MELPIALRWLRRRTFRWQLSSKLLVISLVVTVLAFSAVCGSVLLDMRRSTEELARQTMENLSATIDADVNRNVELYDKSLQSVVKNLALPELAEVSKPILHLILFDRTTTAPHFSPIQVFDAAGNLSLDASTLKPAPERRGDEEFFTAHRDNPDVGLFISRPMLHQGGYSIVLSRRIATPNGDFNGVVVGAIRLGYFHDLFGRLRLDELDVVSILTHGGVIIMRRPFDLDVVGKDFSQVAGVIETLARRSGWFSGTGLDDGVPRMYVWSDSSHPLVVLVGKPWRNILSLWRKEAIRLGAILLVLASFVAGVTIFLIREIDRRARAEQRLEELSITDPLTGLTNRRKFDAAIEDEWRRAQRLQTPVALLMIDADHFKSYNDSFGHQAGDQMLIGIAVCIADSVHRVGDCAARFGGEEFAVLLPGLSAIAALSVAETIRSKVEQWSVDQTGVTISVGTASLTPGPATPWSVLVEAADKALYAAKASGRNRSVLSTPAREWPLVA
ncbi:sensor domain-containing diguanylate cyclase [Rhodopseudomonas rhenobacensis]|uniref:sensor domain-containing diguanylate cyclase n=1 Tax=Rhodopseudomonas rhenobacensis TaxID=87461 RepID=UPI00160BFA26|nr:diguanylate cyclase [Rhodopseudomonas rhenobacensis]